jgi:Beta-ketoacyl synthase, N-terminal domain
MRAYVQGVGLVAAGVANWEAARAILAAGNPYVPGALPAMSPDLLPPAERRRAGLVIRLALTVAQQAVTAARIVPPDLATVFASSDGDGENMNNICLALAAPTVEISPTRFHNSVQNAPSGYWSIATRSHAPSTTANGLDSVFAIGMLEAMAQIHCERRDVLLVCYDVPMPEPLLAKRPLGATCGVALLLGATAMDGTLAAIDVARVPGRKADVTTMPDPAWETLRAANPAARALPLLANIATGNSGRLGFELDPYAILQVDLDASSRTTR